MKTHSWLRLLGPVGVVVTVAVVIALSTDAGAIDPRDFSNRTKERLRLRIRQAADYVMKGNFEGLLSIRHVRARLDFERDTAEDQQRAKRDFEQFVALKKPRLTLVEVQIFGLRGRATMRVSVVEKDGSQTYGAVYDYWVFQNGDWFLEDPNRAL